ncbi:MAG: hypothetical protein QNJ45_16355 [Ardenticatenaceae bacterium]|nr:hypothetical protein [Ardenticatenaceae bacterium]
MLQRLNLSRLIDLLVVLLLSLAGVRPILGPSLPCSDDVAFHLLRLVQLDWLLTNGIPFSRWAPNMANGYGFPLFNYYAPLSYYGAEAVSLLTGDLYSGLQWTFAAGFVLSGWTMFLLARQYVGRPAAYATAAAYLYAPYQGYDIFFRGNLAESFAWWLLPLALWAMVRLVRSGSWRWVGWAALTYAAVLLTHNAFALIFSPLLGAFAVWMWWFERDEKRPSWLALGQIVAALGLGLLLAFFFWFPALTERDLIHTERLLVPPIFVYWGNFVSLSELLALPRTVHPDLLNPSIPRALGGLTALLALPALGWLWPYGKSGLTGRERPIRLLTLFLLLSTAALIFLMLPLSRPVWDTVPLLEFIQFPWRLLGCAALTLALLVGAAVEWLGRRPWGRWAGLIAVPLLVASSLFWFAPRYCAGLEQATIEDIVPFEQATQTIGTTAKGEYQPLTSDFVPAEPFTQPFTLPDDVELLLHSWTPLTFWAEIEAAAPAEITANAFFYPGWTATVNDQKVDIKPREGDGLITFAVPPGRSTIEVEFRETPMRLTANLLSLSALILTLLLLIFPITHHPPPTTLHPTPTTYQPPPITHHPSPTTFAIAGLLLFALVVALPAVSTPLHRPWLPTQADVAPANIYEGGLILHRYQIAARTMPADDSMQVKLWLSAGQPLQRNLQTRVQLVDQEGAIWSPAETVWPRVYRPYFDTVTWPVDEYAEELLLAEGISGTPPGLYTVELVVFDKDSLQPLLDQTGRTALPLGTVQVTRPSRPFKAGGQQTYTGSEGNFDALQLLGSSADRQEAGVGDPFTITAFWGAADLPKLDYLVDLTLVDESEVARWQETFAPVRDDWPTSLWQPGDVWRGRYVARFPADLPAGTYRWTLCARLPDEKCARDPVTVGTVALSAPDRLFDEPAVEQRIERRFGDLATLIGFSGGRCFAENVFPCTIELLWRSEDQTSLSYRVFLQLLDLDGQIVVQSDGEPAAWTRPTTSWVAGEYIVDSRTLEFDLDSTAGYQLVVGLYDPATGERLATPTGENAVVLWP